MNIIKKTNWFIHHDIFNFLGFCPHKTITTFINYKCNIDDNGYKGRVYICGSAILLIMMCVRLLIKKAMLLCITFFILESCYSISQNFLKKRKQLITEIVNYSSLLKIMIKFSIYFSFPYIYKHPNYLL